MPTYLHPYNLILLKTTIEEKYQGGCAQFRIDHKLESTESHQEDDELFSLGFMTIWEPTMDLLKSKGIEFTEGPFHSYDFALFERFGGLGWPTDWLEHNSMFAWHKDCKKWQKEKANYIENSTINELEALQEKGVDPFETIKTEQNI